MAERIHFRAARVLGAAVALAVTSLAGRAYASHDVAAAANAYSRAQRAELQGDYARAADLYELADSLSPTPQALRSALRARRAAGQLAAAAEHAEVLLERYPKDAESHALAEKTLAVAKKKLAREAVQCSPQACLLEVDGSAVGPNPHKQQVVYLDPGTHRIVAVFGKRRTAPKHVTSHAGDSSKLSFTAPPASETPPVTPPAGGGAPTGAASGTPGEDHGLPAPSGKLSPWFFGIGAAATAVLGGVTLWSGLDTLSAHNTYKQHETQAGYQDGLSRERRTNILIAATSIVGAATIATAFFTDWGGHHEAHAGVSAGVTASRAGPFAFVQGRF